MPNRNGRRYIRNPYLHWLKPVALPFFDECCNRGQQYEDTFERIYNGYIDWLDGKPHPTPSRQGFGRLLSSMGYTKRCSNKDSWIRGLRLKG